MGDVLLRVEENVLPNLAKAIMAKTGKSEPLTLPQFQAEVESISGGGSSGGTELNIHYGNEAPEDTSMLWCKCDKPSGVIINPSIISEKSIEYDIGTLPSQQYGIGAVTVGDVIYLFGGYNTATSIRKYNVITGELTTLSATLTTGAKWCKAIKIGNKIYVIDTYSDEYFDEFDIETETITKSTLYARYEYGGFAFCGSNLYQFGGRNGSTYFSSVYKYDLENNTMTSITSLPTNYAKISAETVGDKIYLFGGEKSTSYLSYIYIFDTNTETFTIAPVSLPTGCYHIGTAVFGTDIYLFGGDGSSDLNTILVYDTVNDTIETLETTIRTKSYLIGVASHGENFYLFGGYNSSSIDKFTVRPIVNMGCVQMQSTIKENMFDVIKGDVNIRTGIKNVYLGNADGYGEKVDSYLYQNEAWTQI